MRRAAIATAMWLLLGGCGGGQGSTEMVVSAASSLSDAFEQLAADFEAENPGVVVLLNLDSSATLATQIEGGAPVDVFASADEATMERVVESGEAAARPVGFATNDLVLVTRPGNDLGVAQPSDLPTVIGAGEVVALCAESAPCGVLAEELLAADLRGPVELAESGVTRAPNARATLGAVIRGDAAAAIVYRTDALAAGSAVERVDPPVASPVSTDYLVVPLEGGPGGAELGAEFVELIVSARGREVLEGEGFR